MPLPGVENAVIEPRKLREYLLSPSHPVGRHKAAFFFSLGFEEGDWAVLASELRRHAAENDARELEPSPYGRKFEVRGELRGPVRAVTVLAVWITLEGEAHPRFVTAYPERP